MTDAVDKQLWSNSPLVNFFVESNVNATLFDRIQWCFEDVPAARSCVWTLRQRMYGLSNNRVGRPALWDRLATEVAR